MHIATEYRYRVIGIVQTRVNGVWFERGINDGVFATDQEMAKELVIQRYHRAALHSDPLATTRWHTPELVQVQLV
jgi:hypothetical protein